MDLCANTGKEVLGNKEDDVACTCRTRVFLKKDRASICNTCQSQENIRLHPHRLNPFVEALEHHLTLLLLGIRHSLQKLNIQPYTCFSASICTADDLLPQLCNQQPHQSSDCEQTVTLTPLHQTGGEPSTTTTSSRVDASAAVRS